MKAVAWVGKLGDMEYTDKVYRFERGYLSRKTVIDDGTAVYSSGDGRLFYYAPCRRSSQYKYRVYLVRDGYYLRA